MKLTMEKWHRIDENLKLALEATLKAGATPEYTEDFKGFIGMCPPEDFEKMIHRARSGVRDSILGKQPYQETSDKYYAPRLGPEAFLGQALRKVSFLRHIVKNDDLLWWKLVFYKRSKNKHFGAVMWCGRTGEDKVFGFDAEGGENPPKYLPLAYPGKTGKFEPFFIRVMEYGRHAPYYLKVEAHDEGNGVVVVEVSLVSILKVPAFLRV